MLLVTGGAGFIGSNLLAALEARGDGPLVCCDRLRQADKWRNIAKRELAHVILPEQLEAFLAADGARLRAVVHLGAISATTETDADLILRTNLQLSRRIWDWCTIHGVRLIYASSAATYGDGTHGFVDDAQPEALATLQPMNPYGWSKHLFDRQIARIVAGNGARPPQWAGLKFFNVYGPNEYHKGGQMSVVRHLHPKLAAGKPARLFRSYRDGVEDGGQARDFIHVDDVCRVILWLLDQPGTSGLFNVGTGQARSFADLARATFTAVDQPARIEYVAMPKGLRATYQYFTQADLTHLRAAGYAAPFQSLEDGVALYVREYLARADPYR